MGTFVLFFLCLLLHIYRDDDEGLNFMSSNSPGRDSFDDVEAQNTTGPAEPRPAPLDSILKAFERGFRDLRHGGPGQVHITGIEEAGAEPIPFDHVTITLSDKRSRWASSIKQ